MNGAVDDSFDDLLERPVPATVPRRRRQRLRWVLGVLLVIVLVVVGAGVVVYRQLNSNLTAAPLFSGTSGSAGTEAVDPFGRSALNILVIGSDSRAGAEDCKLGGGCSDTGKNADVEMVVHLSADRSNITVMSVPRDTVTELSACKDSDTGASVAARTGQINSTLAYGPGCTVAAIHKLTGITIDHFMMVDFSGVIAMSDSVGGVSVCVDNDVYDTYSHLKLSKGTHTLQGLGALEFVRSRHAFGDGSDLGRTYAQHVFLSAVVRHVKSKGVLLNPASVLSLAQAATKALTVDEGIASVSKLVSLATDFNKVPAGRVTFTTMQTMPDPVDTNRVVVAPAAEKLFNEIIKDRSLSSTPSTSTATPTVAPSSSTPSGSASPSVTSTSSEAARKKALADAHASTATADSCVPVSTQKTVVVNGVPMSPIEAYAASPDVKVSAP